MAKRIPKLGRHKGTGQGVVYLRGRGIYLGAWPAGMKKAPPEVQQRYEAAIADYLANRFVEPAQKNIEKSGVTIAQCLAVYWEHAQAYFVEPDGTPAKELHVMRRILRTLNSLYGPTPAADFGPLKLIALRDRFISEGLARKTINSFIVKTRSVFRFCASREMISGAQVADLETVTALRFGKTTARESLPIACPSEEDLAKIIDKLPYPIREIAIVLRHTGARVSEILQMRAGEIDRSSEVWSFNPKTHKGVWRGATRTIFFGPACKTVLEPMLHGLEPTDYVFSPKRAETIRLAAIAAKRKTKRWPSHEKRNREKRKAERKRPPGERFESNAITRAMKRASEKLFPMPAELKKQPGESLKAWRERLGPERVTEAEKHSRKFFLHAHSLRHRFAEIVRRELSIDHAMRSLGHSSLSMTQHYSKAGEEQAKEAAKKLG